MIAVAYLADATSRWILGDPEAFMTSYFDQAGKTARASRHEWLPRAVGGIRVSEARSRPKRSESVLAAHRLLLAASTPGVLIMRGLSR